MRTRSLTQGNTSTCDVIDGDEDTPLPPPRTAKETTPPRIQISQPTLISQTYDISKQAHLIELNQNQQASNESKGENNVDLTPRSPRPSVCVESDDDYHVYQDESFMSASPALASKCTETPPLPPTTKKEASLKRLAPPKPAAPSALASKSTPSVGGVDRVRCPSPPPLSPQLLAEIVRGFKRNGKSLFKLSKE